MESPEGRSLAPGPVFGVNFGFSGFAGMVFGPTSNVRGEMVNLNIAVGGVINVTLTNGESKVSRSSWFHRRTRNRSSVARYGFSVREQTGTLVAGECGG